MPDELIEQLRDLIGDAQKLVEDLESWYHYSQEEQEELLQEVKELLG